MERLSRDFIKLRSGRADIYGALLAQSSAFKISKLSISADFNEKFTRLLSAAA